MSSKLEIPDKAFEQHAIALGKKRLRRAFGSAQAWRTATPTEIGYAAGLFDGEGNVVIAVNHKGGARGAYLIYNMRLGVSQNDPAPLFWLRERWGGSVRKSGQRAHIWQQFSLGALAFLRDVVPHLQVKRARAILAIKYQEGVARRGRGGRGPEYLKACRHMKAIMNHLNCPNRFPWPKSVELPTEAIA